MYLLLIFLPLIGSFSAGFLGFLIGPFGSSIITTSFVFLSFIFSILSFYKVIFLQTPFYIIISPWIYSEIFQCNWGFLFDSLTVIMLCIVTSISTLVHLYSTEYMSQDPHLSRFMSYLSLFTFFMLILVTADNFIQMFVGWEGVGFCSYLLINFWFTRIQANKSAIKAMLINRISDFAIVLGFSLIFKYFKTLDYTTVFTLAPLYLNFKIIFLNIEFNLLNTICFLILLGAMGKSAQIILHTWLPDAMEGPTPVSALIHAATMVTAGVFLIARCSPIFEYSNFVLKLIILVGSITAFFAGTVGLLQNDLKRVIAYSTCSQLGYMILACGLSNYSVGVFHLSNHAFFKALLFLSAGSVIHAMTDEQDIRRMGGLRSILPFTYSMFLIGSLALAGFPFLTGFYSKDVILEVAFSSHSIIGHFGYWLGTFSAFLTAFYSIRLLYITFLTETNSFKSIIINAHDAPIRMSLPLFFLSIGSIFIGYLSRDLFIGLGTDSWKNALFFHPINYSLIDAEFLPIFIKILPVLLSIIGLLSSFIFYKNYFEILFYLKMSSLGYFFYNFLNRKWFFDKLYQEIIGQNILKYSYFITYKLIDKGFLEIFGPYGITNFIYKLSLSLSKIQTGFLFNYTFFILMGSFFCNILLYLNI